MNLNIRITNYKDISEEIVDIVIDFKDIFPYEFVLNVILLKEDLINEIVLINSNGNIIIKKGKNIKYLHKDKKSVLFVDENVIGYWLAYFLNYYKNGYADVSHIHTEFSHENLKNNSVDLIFNVANSAPGMTGEEATKILREEE